MSTTSDLNPNRETGLAEQEEELDLADEGTTVITTKTVPPSADDAGSVTTQVVPTPDDDDGIQGETK